MQNSYSILLTPELAERISNVFRSRERIVFRKNKNRAKSGETAKASLKSYRLAGVSSCFMFSDVTDDCN